MSTLLPQIGARELAPRRPLCKRPRKKRGAAPQKLLRQVAEKAVRRWRMNYTRHFCDMAYGRINVTLSDTEKLVMFYIAVRLFQWPQMFECLCLDEICSEEGGALGLSEARMRRAFDGLRRKGALRGIPGLEYLHEERQKETQNG